jgi:glutamate-1-semialdehyde aminotransferase
MDQWPRVVRWCQVCAERGVWFHPFHNNFLMAAHTDADIDEALQATDAAFEQVNCAAHELRAPRLFSLPFRALSSLGAA